MSQQLDGTVSFLTLLCIFRTVIPVLAESDRRELNIVLLKAISQFRRVREIPHSGEDRLNAGHSRLGGDFNHVSEAVHPVGPRIPHEPSVTFISEFYNFITTKK